MLQIIIIINILIALAIIFLERKDPSATLAWIMVLLFIPVLGTIFYIVFSQNISRQKIFRLYENEEQMISTSLTKQKNAITDGSFPFENEAAEKWSDVIKLNQTCAHAYYTQDNDISLITDGKEKMKALFDDIDNARSYVNIQYFIVKKDIVGDAFLKLLIKKAREGVEVRFLVDALGSRNINRDLVKIFKESGGHYAEFFPTHFKLFNTKLNYRNHRKMAIIDDKIGYIGGFNIAREYVGLKRKFGYWRDTHVRIKGGSICDLNARFLLDWRSATKEKINIGEKFFEPIKEYGNMGVQIVSSGPDNDREEIKHGFLKMITSAKKSIYIQTPYFVPDAPILESLKMAAQSGVDVNVMIPCMPDHMFVYWATYSYVAELMEVGANIYIYDNGFLHAKVLAVDDEICTIGSTNFDRRSFKLNFEANAFIYDIGFTKKVVESFRKDTEKSHRLTAQLYENRGAWIKIKEVFSRILSDLL